jgi:hypothetical protein
MKKLKFLLLLLIAVSIVLMPSCKKKHDPEPTPTPPYDPNKITSAYYFQGTIDGQLLTIQDGNDTYSFSSIPTGSSNTVDQVVYMDNLLNNYPTVGYDIIETFSSSPLPSDYEGMFGIGSHTYAPLSLHGDSVSVHYVDANSVLWRTGWGTRDQTGSTFKITEKTSLNAAPGNQHLITKAEFSCKLYDGNGHMKTFTNCVFRSKTCYY